MVEVKAWVLRRGCQMLERSVVRRRGRRPGVTDLKNAPKARRRHDGDEARFDSVEEPDAERDASDYLSLTAPQIATIGPTNRLEKPVKGRENSNPFEEIPRPQVVHEVVDDERHLRLRLSRDDNDPLVL